MMQQHIEKIKTLFFSPTVFFKSIVKENRYFPILIFFVAIYGIGQIIEFIVSIPTLISVPGAMTLLTVNIALFSIVISAFLTPFIGSGIVHLGVLIVRGKNGFFNTFKPITYAMIIGVVYGIMSTIVMFVLNMVNPIDVAALQSGNFSFRDLPIFTLAVGILIGIISLIHVIIAGMLGIIRYQNLTKGKALFAVIFPYILVVLAMIGSIAYFGTLSPDGFLPS